MKIRIHEKIKKTKSGYFATSKSGKHLSKKPHKTKKDAVAQLAAVEISKKDVDNKVKAMSYYDTEVKPLPFPRCEDMIRMTCSTRGSQIGVKNAEAFSLIRGLVR